MFLGCSYVRPSVCPSVRVCMTELSERYILSEFHRICNVFAWGNNDELVRF